MKTGSIKFKITFWYSAIILVVFVIVLGGAIYSSEYYSSSNIKEELLDEVKDLQKELYRYPDTITDESIVPFYDDGIMLSVYDKDFNFINGFVPDIFPSDVPFQDNTLQEVNDGEDKWFLYDRKTTMPDGNNYWIRGVYSVSSINVMMQRFTTLLAVLLPILMIITAFVGYRMINRSLQPINAIHQTANDIIASSDLSLRLDVPAAKDEFYYLTKTFNQMFDHLENQFVREQQFTSDAAHELRTPVCAILSHCEYCLDELELTPEAREELMTIHKKTLGMSDLINSLLLIARAENGRYMPNYEEVNLEIIAETVFDELGEKAAAKNIDLELIHQMKNPVILADMDMMMRLFLNLTSNGINYGKNNGFFRISMTQVEQQICLEFTDNGIGIPPEKIDRIWDRFYQADASHSSEGFGLGLFMVKYIVNCHNGTIQAESTVGGGTKFTVCLPMKGTKHDE